MNGLLLLLFLTASIAKGLTHVPHVWKIKNQTGNAVNTEQDSILILTCS